MTHELQEKLAQTMADHLLKFKTALSTQFSQSLFDQRQTIEVSMTALTQNMASMAGGQKMLQQEMGQLKADVAQSFDQRQTIEVSMAALAQNMASMAGGQKMIQQEMGHLKADVVHSLEFLEKQQMQGEEAWKGVYAEVSSIDTRMVQREQSSELPDRK